MGLVVVVVVVVEEVVPPHPGTFDGWSQTASAGLNTVPILHFNT